MNQIGIAKMGKRDSITQISDYIFAGFKFLYLYTTEELKTLEILKEVAQEIEAEKIYTYYTVRLYGQRAGM